MNAFMILTLLGLTQTAQAFEKTLWTGDLLCARATRGQALVADAKGRIEVTQDSEYGIPEVKVVLDEVRLFSEGGTVRGSTFKKMELEGEAFDGNDYWFVTLTDQRNSQERKIIKDITLDLSTYDKGLSKIVTLKGNEYVMECLVRQD